MQPLMSDNSSGTLNSYSSSSPSSSMIQMNNVQRYIENPDRLKIDLPSILEKGGNLDQVVSILEEVMEKSPPEDQVIVAQCIYDTFMDFPNDFQENLLKEQPLFFVQLVEYWSVEQRQRVLKHLTGQFENWKKLFVGIFEILNFREVEKKPNEKLPGRFLAHLIESFSPRRKRQWIKHCSQEMNYNNWAFLVIALKPEDRKIALRVASKSFDYDLSQDGFLFCFEAFADQMDQHSIDVKIIMGKLLHNFYLAKKFTVIIEQFKSLNSKTQVCVLDAAIPSKQSRLLHHYRGDINMMAQLFDELFLLQKGFHEQRGVIERFAQVLNQDNLSEFMQFLLINHSKAGAYLLVCLPDEIFQNFIYDIDVNLRTEILLKSDFSSTTEELLNFAMPERKILIYVSMGLMSKDVSIEYYTVNHFFDSFKDAVDEILVNYTSSIISIPPVLIGLVTKMGNHHDLLIRLTPFMNDEQLKFFVSVLNQSQFYTFVENHSLLLGFGKQETLLKGLSTKKLIHYVQQKTKDLKNAQKKFHEEYDKLQSALNAIEEGEMLHSKDVEKLENQAVKLHTLARLPLQSNYHHLGRFLKDLKQNNASPDFRLILDELQKSMEHLKSKCLLFQRPHGIIIHKLDAIKNSMFVEEEENIDLTGILYDGFWTVVRDGTLPYLGISPHSELGITNPNQLSCLGILSDADLNHLGISAELQKNVTNLILELEKLQVVKPKTENNAEKVTISELWNECTQIKLSEDEVRAKCQQIIHLLELASISSKNLKKGCVDFCKEVFKFPHLSGTDKSIMRRTCTTFSKSRGKKMISQGNNLLMKALILLRAQHPLFCLQRYLVHNVNLKHTWEMLRLNGYSSIHDLFEKQLISNPIDLFRLEEVAKKNDLQPMQIA